MSVRSNYNREPSLVSRRTAIGAEEVGEIFISALEDAGFETPSYDLEDFVAGTTGIAYATDREYDDSFERPDVTPELTFRYQGPDTPNSLDQYPIQGKEARDELLENVVAGDVRIPVSDPVPADVASAKTGVAEELTSEEPYVEPGERSVDLQFAVAGANPPGTISTAMNNTREAIEAMAYIQDQRLPPGMAVNAFDGRIQSNPAPDVTPPEGEEAFTSSVDDFYDSSTSDIKIEAVDSVGEDDGVDLSSVMEEVGYMEETDSMGLLEQFLEERDSNGILEKKPEYEELFSVEQEIRPDRQF